MSRKKALFVCMVMLSPQVLMGMPIGLYASLCIVMACPLFIHWLWSVVDGSEKHE